jgi:hypothetical protein
MTLRLIVFPLDKMANSDILLPRPKYLDWVVDDSKGTQFCPTREENFLL